MISAGIDIGSRTIALVTLNGLEETQTLLGDTGYTPLETAKRMIASLGNKSFITATGYGRHSAKADFAHKVITEIKAHALGVFHLFPAAKTVLDIGGQDMKVILLEKGKVLDFQMNDKCSAGTGKFIEVMAGALGYNSTREFGIDSLLGNEAPKISSMCTVFAESEAVTLLHGGTNRRDIGRALHLSVVERAVGLLQRVGYEQPLVFTGGVALNPCIINLLREKINGEVIVPAQPQLVGALGAALAGLNKEI